MERPQGKTSAEQHRDVARVEAFSDGVFAFAITLLVLGIRIPRPGDLDASAGLQRLLVEQWPSYVAFALTFIVVGTVWANHRLAFSHFVRTDHVLVSLNLLELMSVAFLPLPTGVLGTWVASERNRLTAVVFYGATLVVLGIFHNLLWWYGAYRGRLTSPDLTEHGRRALALTWMAGPVFYGVSVGLAWVDPRLSLAGFVVLGIIYLLPTPRILALAQRRRNSRQGRHGTQGQ
ncbi:MAG TPA: TMEM175 family protein, partial [Candidatus Dormibacteraeota bacterium]